MPWRCSLLGAVLSDFGLGISMGRRSQNLKRIQLDITEKALTRLQWLQEETDSLSIAEVIRDSIDLREAIVRLRMEGKKIVAEDEKTGDRTLLIL